METLRALPKVESENLFWTEKEKGQHWVLEMKPGVSVSSDLKSMAPEVSAGFW
jgi:carbamoylphosphate synthase large subunit